jgi:ABC-type glycerol-3-phosphate transport system permease component
MHKTGAPGEDKFEVSDWHLKIILVTGVFMVVVAVVSFAICYMIMNSFQKMDSISDYKPSPLAEEHQEWAASPRIQVQPWDTLDAYTAESAHVSDSYGIVSELENGDTVYRIPIETAMSIVEEHGFPKFQPLTEKIKIAPTANEH